ncbi:NUDIX domain-containing protein [Tropicibacter naphthalenivorans]|uniref:RNA pyrophosphohydrolase n=1 Tax=Tropicibacter naphthalenivorans TaxID=441103 RepID=A0A0P1GEX2_9RHOB|nr:NUDIX hydrolase [Tropicibacter naphthalenivorans]CUH79603.1 RNA pyrophosphohydrolase [Tropicibacter naphthalenivorans]SMC73709.1 8-oxo-dGTP diphosphatase [Tropicibacter naphthalenivorans]
MTPRFGDAPESGRRYVTRPGAYVILPRAGSLLLTYQSHPYPEFQLPGGGIDPGEGPIEALHREVFEETGWRMTRPRRLGAFRRFTFMPEYEIWAEKVCLIYTAMPVRPLGPPTEPHHVPTWMPVAEAAERLGNPGDAAFVRRFARSSRR